MKAIKIDVEKQTIDYIQIEPGLGPIYEAIGNNCTIFEVPIILNNNDGIYVDEEGCNKGLKHIRGAFKYDGWILVNNALVIGANSEGESVDVKTKKEFFAQRIRFISVNELLALQ
jgi:hypothetical protein